MGKINDRYDYVVIGAGGAGMQLVYRLIIEGIFEDRTALIIDPDTKEKNDRTWCFWARDGDDIAEAYAPVISKSWSSCLVDGDVQSLKPYTYHHISGIDFYNFVKQSLSGCDGVEWICASAGHVEHSDDGAVVSVGDKLIQCGYVFDSRIPVSQKEKLKVEGMVWQSFYGWRVKLDNALLNEEAFTMMDFGIPQQGSTQFIYELPYGRDEMLVEVTRFDMHAITKDEAERMLSIHMSAYGCNYNILEKEEGKIPMTMGLQPDKAHVHLKNRHIHIGTAGGAVKPSTGYAFKSMYDHASQIAHAIKEDQDLPMIKQEGRFAFYDRLLLTILYMMPQWGKPIFTSLLSKVSMGRVIEFLDERTNLANEVPILWSLPFRPFFKSLYINYLAPVFTDSKRLATDLVTLLIMGVLIGVYSYVDDPPASLELSILLVGLVFPGIPHGSCDHVFSLGRQTSAPKLMSFVMTYLLVMAVVIGVWLVNPLVGLVLFLLYSAWHFGETDTLHWSVYSPWTAWMHGMGLLLFLLASHPVETVTYFESFRVFVLSDVLINYHVELSVIGFVLLVLPGILSSIWTKPSWLITVLVVSGGLFLPLLPAFALYFVGLHSWRGWRHLQDGLEISSIELFKASMPFSVSAYVLFILLFLMSRVYAWDIEGLVPWIFIFIAAISAPHIVLMHIFYDRAR